MANCGARQTFGIKAELQEKGFAFWLTSVTEGERDLLRQTVFRQGYAGTRCLLSLESVSTLARAVGRELIDVGILDPKAVAVQAIAFDKSASTNWKVSWHQDLMFPFACAVNSPEYKLSSEKDGVHFARPPCEVLERMLAVRVHLDCCDEQNGPLRVASGTHHLGLIPSAEISLHVARCGEVICTAKEGEALLMRPLLLHASSKAAVPRHRRVLHLVYYSGTPVSEQWHCAVVLK